MADEVIIAKFRAELDDVKAEFEAYIKELEKAKNKEKEVQDQTKKTGDTAESAAKKRNQAIKSEQATLKELQKARKQAFDVKTISDFNAKINETKNRIAVLKGETNNFADTLKSSITNFGAGVAAAFSVGAIIEFGKNAANAFIEAEENAKKLEFAITQIGNEGQAAYQKLINQSEKLQKISIFSDDDIQRAQTQLATFGLTSNQIEKLIPKVLDFASATRTDLASATDTFTKALEGQTRGLTDAGLKFTDTGTRIGNLNVLMASTEKLAGASADALDTLAGSLKSAENEANALEEEIGSKFAGTLVQLKLDALKLTKAFIDLFKTRNELNAELSLQKSEDIKDSQAYGIQIEAERKKVDQLVVANERYINVGGRLNEIQKELDSTANTPAFFERRAKLEAERAVLVQTAGAIKEIINELKEQEKQESRILTAQQLKKFSVDQLNDSLKENQQLNDAISKDNVDLINKELEARKKLQEALDKREKSEEKIALLQKKSAFKPNEAKDNAKKAEEDYTKFIEDENQKRVDSFAEAEKKINTSLLDSILGRYEKEIDATLKFTQTIAGLFDALANNRIDKINKEKDAELERIDASLNANEEALNKRRITEVEAENTKKKLEAERLAAEKKAAEESRKIKKKQAILDKAAALFQITIDTARAIAEASPVVPLEILAAATGAAQAAIVLAQPIPYAKGTKSAKGGLSLVGEHGAEMTMLPEGTKVAPARQTKKYTKVFDSIVDDSFESYVTKNMIAPALQKQRQEFEQERGRSFAENIKNAIVIEGNRTDFSGLDRLQRKGLPMSNVDEFAQVIGKAIAQNPYRR